MGGKERSFPCPHCGGIVPAGARACPECGSDEQTGWSDETYLDGIGLYDETDYEETLRREGLHPTQKASRMGVWWMLPAVVLIVLFIVRFLLCTTG